MMEKNRKIPLGRKRIEKTWKKRKKILMNKSVLQEFNLILFQLISNNWFLVGIFLYVWNYQDVSTFSGSVGVLKPFGF